MDSPLRRTPLYQLHVERGARVVPFAGYEMPLQYEQGILKEHLHCRAAAGLFDVSHMGQIALYPFSGRREDAARALETLVPVDVLGLPEGRLRYGFFTDAAGGILDDLMIAARNDHLLLVVNAACKEDDAAHLEKHLSQVCRVERLDNRALVALQGPRAESVLVKLAPDAADMRFMDVRTLRLVGTDCEVSRSGYTGEDGFEISVPAEKADTLARALLQDDVVWPIGLGARDSLRLEAGLCLYGSDLDATTSPIEAALEWAIQKVRRRDGARAGGFPGAETILRQFEDGAPRRRVGLRPVGRAPVRGGAKVFGDQNGRDILGVVTSGGFGPSVNAPVAMGYVERGASAIGTELFVETRGQYLSVRVCEMPFFPTRYKR